MDPLSLVANIVFAEPEESFSFNSQRIGKIINIFWLSKDDQQPTAYSEDEKKDRRTKRQKNGGTGHNKGS